MEHRYVKARILDMSFMPTMDDFNDKVSRLFVESRDSGMWISRNKIRESLAESIGFRSYQHFRVCRSIFDSLYRHGLIEGQAHAFDDHMFYFKESSDDL